MKNLALLFSIIVLASGICFAQTSAFSYQGKLANTGTPASGVYQFEFKLFDADTGTNQIGSTQTVVATVQNGVFTTRLDFGATSFPAGGDRWLEVSVRLNASGDAYTVLSPRQEVNSVPFAVRSLKATNADNADSATTAITANTSTTAENVTGVVQTRNGGTGLSSPHTAGNFLRSDGTNWASAALQLSDIPSGSTNYIQNIPGIGQQSGSFNIDGGGSANIFNAATQFNIGGNVVLSVVGPNNFFAGVGAGQTGTENSFVGRNAGLANTTGSNNAFLGQASGRANLSGSFNAFFGGAAGLANTDGDENSFFGYEAGSGNVIGSANSFFGKFAGSTNTSGSGNVFIGHNANPLSTGLNNATAIGSFAAVSQSNSLVLGSISGVNGAALSTNVGIGTTAPTEKLQVANGNIRWSNSILQDNQGGSIELGGTSGIAGSGTPYVDFHFGGLTEDFNVRLINDAATQLSLLGNLRVTGNIKLVALGSAGITPLCYNTANAISSCSSSIRYKQNILPFVSGLSLIKRLRPVSFNWRAGNQADLGLVAEQVNAVEPLLTTTNEAGEVEGVKYDRVGVVLINAVNEQQLQIEAQQKQINEQKMLIEALRVLVCTQNPTAAICHPGN